MSFHVGQKVVCVNDDFSEYGDPVYTLNVQNRPHRGRTYTIRGFAYVREGIQTVVLEEIQNPEVKWIEPYGLAEPAFGLHRFRPLLQRGTAIGMAILRRVADDAAKRRNLVVSR